MAQEVINIGVQADDGTGDTIRGAGIKINSNFTELYTDPLVATSLGFLENEISTTQSNADIVLKPSGTGVVTFLNLKIDSNINITDNEITTTVSNSDLVLSGSGTGLVKIGKADINGGAIDGTTIGANSAVASTFTTITVPSVNADKVNITDNKIKATDTDAHLVVGANGSGNVLINGFTFPNTVLAGQLIKTNASKVLSTVVLPFVVSDTDVSDGTDTITGNSVAQTFDTFAHATYRSAKYTIQISDATANRFAVVDASVTHDGTNAYISTTGGTSNGTGDGSTVYDPLEFTAIISGSDVRVRAKVNNTNSHVLKFVRRIIKV